MTKNQTATRTASTTGDAKAPTTRACTCGCGLATSSSKTMYKPGHDARHAGQVARRIVEKHLHGDAAQAELKALPTANLQHKAGQMVTRLLAKAEALAVKELAKSTAKTAKDAKAGKKASAKKDQTEGSQRAEALIDGLQEAVEGELAKIVAKEEAEHAAQLATEVELRRADIEAMDEFEKAEAMDEAEQAEYTVTEGVKVGRWVYPGRKLANGELQRNTKRDGSGEWVAL